MFFARFVKGVIIYGVHKGGGVGWGEVTAVLDNFADDCGL